MTLLLAHGCVIGFGTLLFWALPELVRRAPRWMINLPNKEYWLSPERRGIATTKFAIWADTFGTAVNVLMITLQLVLSGDTDEAMARPTFVPGFALGGFLLFTLGSLIWLVASYRIPTRTE
jgi:hypothetical protein